MAPTATKPTGTRIQTWLPLSLAEQLKAQADPDQVLRLLMPGLLRQPGGFEGLQLIAETPKPNDLPLAHNSKPCR